MANTLEHIAQGLLRPINPYGTILIGLLTLFWGLWIVSPFWAVFTRADVYSKIDYFPELAWGSWSSACGFLICFSLWKGSFKWLARCLAFAGWHWTMVAIFLWWGDWQNTAGLTYTFIFIYCAYSYLNVKVNFRYDGDFHFLSNC